MREFLSRKAVILGSVIVIVMAVAAGGYYWVNATSTGSGKTVSIAQSDVCALTVARALDYGALPFDAKKLDIKTVDTANPNRITCAAKTAEATYSLTADVACDDAQKAECLVLQKVTHENGTALYDTQI